jgi:hypothetical protein
MASLSQNWLTEGILDFEYKKYILLAYLQKVRKSFDSAKLYPQLAELILHYRNLKSLSENKQLMRNAFPCELESMDMEKLTVNYRRMLQDDEVMQELHDIICYAIPKVQRTLEQGKDIYEYVEKHIKFDTVGVLPIYKTEGYLMLQSGAGAEVFVYRYKMSMIDAHSQPLRAISTSLVHREAVSIANSLTTIKLHLVNSYKDLPNPATWFVESTLSVPIVETLLPVSKRKLLLEL